MSKEANAIADIVAIAETLRIGPRQAVKFSGEPTTRTVITITDNAAREMGDSLLQAVCTLGYAEIASLFVGELERSEAARKRRP